MTDPLGPVRLRRGVRLRHDRVRDRFLLLAPERGYVLNDGALTVLGWIDGRDLAAIEATARGAGASEAEAAQVIAFVRRLGALGLLEPAGAP